MPRPDYAYWLRSPGHGELRPITVPEPGPDQVLVRTVFSGVSRGTELLVHSGAVPANQHHLMRAPFQEGEFPAPVKYGYLSVGVVEQGPEPLRGRTVFCLYPHQTRYVVPAEAVVPVPESVPAARAILAGTVETAVNALWDAPPRLGDRIAVVGAGMVGGSVAGLLARFPGVRVELVDTDPRRAAVAEAFGVPFASPDRATGDCDLVFHASASEAGLARSLRLLAPEGTVVELSWYGDRPVQVPLGEHFHSRRLTVRASQVGSVSPGRTGGWQTADRRALALELLGDPAFDILISGECEFARLPELFVELAEGRRGGLCQRVRYPQPEPSASTGAGE